MIQKIEELTFNAWPALSTLFYDGWIIRLSAGYTRRANSVNPLYSSSITLPEKITSCEVFYKTRNLKTIFKMTSHVHPKNLDTILEKEGYNYEAETSVQFLELDGIEEFKDNNIKISEQSEELWFTEFSKQKNMSQHNYEIHKSIVNKIELPKAFLLVYDNRDIIGFGLGVLEHKYIGVYDILVDELHRNKGIGFRIMSSLLHWGKSRGAEYSYLQVMVNNKAGLGLYKKFGYRELYKYWYRVKGSIHNCNNIVK